MEEDGGEKSLRFGWGEEKEQKQVERSEQKAVSKEVAVT